jgi:tetratricopeptide (TPR) repeat protein
MNEVLSMRFNAVQIRVVGLIIILPLIALVISAAPPASPDDFIRAGNQAAEREDYESALQLYQQAEERGFDPGLIAFNKAAAYYHLRDFRQAENHYRMALGDAAIPSERRTKAFFNLGDCLVEQAGDKDAKMLHEAIRCYEHCLDSGPDEGLRNDAIHNLELAKLLWIKAAAEDREKPTPNTADPPDPPERDPNEPKKDDLGADAGDEPDKNNERKLDQDPNGKVTGKDEPKKVDPAPKPGPSHLPVIADTDELIERSPEDTRAALKQAEMRLKEARQRNRMDLAIPEKSNVKDW